MLLKRGNGWVTLQDIAQLIDAIEYAHTEIRKIVAAEKEIFTRLGVKKREVVAPARNEAVYQEVAKKVSASLHEAMDTSKYPKLESERRIDALRDELLAGYPEDDEDVRREARHAFEALYERLFRDDVLLTGNPS